MAEHDSNAILAEFLRRIDSGEAVSIDAICQAHPEIADDLRSYVDGDALLAGMAAEESSQTGAHDETARPRGQAGPVVDISGQKFGRYEIRRQLGQGAMGAVYLARDTQLDRDVALKIPKVDLAEKSEFLARFKREAQSAAKLNNANLCQVHDFGEIDGQPFITMSYIDGEPLSRFVGRSSIDNQWIADTIRKIAAGLDHAHRNGVVHRDLKSANVLVDRLGEPIVTDFGLAGRVDESDDTRLTKYGQILGTPAYMAPEQIEGDSSIIGPSSDIYSLGVMLYELLAGELPFRGSVYALFAQIARDDAKSPMKRNPDADLGLCNLCLEMLAKSPAKRPATMGEVASRLEKLAIGTKQQAANTTDKKTERNRAKLGAGKERVAELVKRGQFAQAVSILEKMAALKDKDSADYVEWASAEIKRIKALPKKLRDGAPQLLSTAQKLMARHDYGQAAQLLQQIPANMRLPEAERLLGEAIELQDEADLLLTDLKDCVATRTYEGIEDNVKRLLELKPGNKFARDVWEALQTYQRIPRSQRNYRFDSDGNLQPRDEGLSKGLLAGVGVGVLVFAVMSWFMKDYLATKSPENGKIVVRTGSAPDAGTTTGPVELLRVVNLAGLDPDSEVTRYPWPMPDGKTLFYDVADQATKDHHLSVATRADFNSPYKWQRALPQAMSPCLSADGLEVFGLIPYSGSQLICSATRKSTDDDFPKPQRIKEFSDDMGFVAHPAISADGLTLYFELIGDHSSQTTVNNLIRQVDNTTISYSTRTSRKGPWSRPKPVPIEPARTGLRFPSVALGGRYLFCSVADPNSGFPIILVYRRDDADGSYRELGPIIVNGSELRGRFPRYVEASNELYFEQRTNESPLQVSVLEGFDPDEYFKSFSNNTVASNEGWTTLFNGRDFTGWQYYKGGAVNNGWEVRDGQLWITPSPRGVVKDYPYDIITTDTYGDFELEFEWMVPQAANSGVIYRVTRDSENAYKTGIEYQVLDDPNSPDSRAEIRTTGSIYGLYGKEPPLQPTGQFNRSRVVANGNHIEHWLNGQLVAEAEVGSSEWDKAVRAGNASGWPEFMKSRRGHICLQNKGKIVCYRNIRIREITPASQPSHSGASVVPDRFTYPRPLTETATTGSPINAYPWISPDGLTIYWTSEGPDSDSGIFQATRPSPHFPFGSRRKVCDGRIAAVSSDGLEIVTLAVGGGNAPLVSARRDSTSKRFETPEPIPAFSGYQTPKAVAFAPGDNALFFVNKNTLAGGSEIHRSVRSDGNQPWQPPQRVVVEGLAADMHRLTHPSLSPDGRHLFFSFVDTTKPGREWGAIADATSDPTRFVNARPLLLDGERFITRGGRFCEATGELFYSHMDGEPPFRDMEIRVADLAQKN